MYRAPDSTWSTYVLLKKKKKFVCVLWNSGSSKSQCPRQGSLLSQSNRVLMIKYLKIINSKMFYDKNLWDIATDTLKGKCITKIPLFKKIFRSWNRFKVNPFQPKLRKVVCNISLCLLWSLDLPAFFWSREFYQYFCSISSDYFLGGHLFTGGDCESVFRDSQTRAHEL